MELELKSLALSGKSAKFMVELLDVVRFQELLKDVPEMFAAKEKELAELEAAIQKAREEPVGKDSHVIYIGKTGRGLSYDFSLLAILMNGTIFDDVPIAKAMRMEPEQGHKLISGSKLTDEIKELGVECLHVREAMEKGLKYLRNDIAEAHKEEESVRNRIAEFYAAHPSLKAGLETEMPVPDKDHPTDADRTKHPE